MLSFAKKYANNVYSQNGEDGIIAEVVKRLDLKTGLCCEFGAHDGKTFSNVAALINQDWPAVLIESDVILYKKCKETWKNKKEVVSLSAEVTADNVNMLVPPNTDVLNIDIEQSCYDVWKALDHRPAVVIIEINSSLHPLKDHVSGKHGANYSAMAKLGIEKGYFLLCHTGNMIFILNDRKPLFAELIKNEQSTNESEKYYEALDDVSLFFNTSWLPSNMIKDWEKPSPITTQTIDDNNPISLTAVPAVNNEPNKPIVKLTNALSIGILVTATWKFIDFIPQLAKSLENFCPGHKKTIYLFTDAKEVKLSGITIIHIVHKPYPVISLERYSRYLKFANQYYHEDYLFHFDADMRVVSVGNEILQPLLAVQHPLFYEKPGTWEPNPQSKAYVPADKKKKYVCGGIQGGQTADYLAACSLLSRHIEEDYSNEIIAEWHDESHWNWLIANHPQKITILDAGYCYPEELTIPFQKKIMALDKDKTIYRESK